MTKIRESAKKNKDLNRNAAASWSSLGVLHRFLQMLSPQEPIRVTGYDIEDVSNILISAKGAPDDMHLDSPFLLKSDIILRSLLGKKAHRLMRDQKNLYRNDSERYFSLRRWIDLALVTISPYLFDNEDRVRSGLRRTTTTAATDSSATGSFKPFNNRSFGTTTVNERDPQLVSKRAQIKLKSDVLTLGRSIFFPESVDIYTPKGFAMLTHEITHVHQYDQDAELRRGNVSEFRRTLLEKDALNNEQTILDYFSRLTRRNRNLPLMHGVSPSASSSSSSSSSPALHRTSTISPFTSNLTGEFNLHIPPILTSAQTFALNDLKNISSGDSDNNNNNRSLSLQNFSRDILSFLSAANSRIGSSSRGTSSMPYVESPEKREVPEMILGTKSPTYSAVPAMDLAGTAPQPPTTAVPLYAETDRPLTSQPTGDNASLNPMPASTNGTSYDLDVIVNKVYELFERKIKKERERKGIR